MKTSCISRCEIVHYLGNKDLMAVNVVYDDNSTEEPFLTYYDNEVTFSADEFVGKTREDAYSYYIDKRQSFITRAKREDQ